MESKVLFEAFGGNELTGSPESIFRYLAEHRTGKYTFVWAVSDRDANWSQIRELRRVARIKVVRRGSREYYRQLYTSRFLVNNMSFPSDFVKREAQTYINTWHGVPLKKMGFDVEGAIENGRNVMRNFLMTDYLLSSSRAMTERLYLGAFKLTNVFEGTILEHGQPATDEMADSERARELLHRQSPQLNLLADRRKVVLYAPTWRGDNYEHPDAGADLIVGAVEAIDKVLDPKTHRLLVKPHQVVAGQLASNPRLRERLVPRGTNAHRVLAVTDVLVSDYSSIFYDFLSTGRPVIHYVPDAADYAEYRDVYDAEDAWPGIVAHDGTELQAAVAASTHENREFPDSRYRDSAVKWVGNDDGHVAERVVRIAFDGQTEPQEMQSPKDGREKLLIYVGPLIPNGITSSVKNLLANLDYDRYDVSVLVPYSSTDEQRRQQWNSLDPRARVIFRFGHFTGSALANWARTLRLNFGGLQLGRNSASARKIWRQEWHRMFGKANFDHLVDFTGYSPFWGALFIAADSGQRAIWQHNDLAADANRTINGKRHLHMGLTKVFALYPWFDRVISVSEELMNINRQKLGSRETFDKFDWVPNTMDLSGLQSVENWRQTRLKSYNEKTEYTFVNVGRLSPEKNQGRLLDAFATIAGRLPNTILKLVGDGPLRADLERRSAELGLEGRVIFTGLVEDPYRQMAEADCLVVSSDYEGQPMVILEAMAIGLPVITTNFGSVAGAFPDGTGVIVGMSSDALAGAMEEALRNSIDVPEFSAACYNAEAIRRFENVLASNHTSSAIESTNRKQTKAESNHERP